MFCLYHQYYPFTIFFLLIAVAPSFDTHLLNDLVVRAGQKISYNIPIVASPKPKATWTRDGVQIVADARHEMFTTNTETSFEIPFSVRGDTGRYALTLENEHGSFRYLTNQRIIIALKLLWYFSLIDI